MYRHFQRIFPLLCTLVILFNALSVPAYAHISFDEGGVAGTIVEWLGGSVWFDDIWGTDHSWQYASNKPQKYYTTPTSSVQDKNGNVTNYYRGGDTTDMRIIDSYNKTFNTIHNTTNNTNNYKANVRLSDFLNNYTTNNITNTTNNQYTYSADFNSWYYDNTTNNYNYTSFTKNDYTQNNLYYNQDNSRYYISIDNSTDEYYLVDVQYSPTFVTVNYTYNTTNNKYDKDVGDVTNVYYYELKDGRNSSTLTASEVAGLDLDYDVVNYELVTDDPNTLSLQHFDGDYTDSSSFNRTFYSQNRSTNYVDSGAFGKAVTLPNGSAAGVTIPGLSGYNSLSFDFRVYYNDISSLGVYFGDTNIFGAIPVSRSWHLVQYYDDHNNTAKRISSNGGMLNGWWLNKIYSKGTVFRRNDLSNCYFYDFIYYADYNSGLRNGSSPYISSTFSAGDSAPASYTSTGYTDSRLLYGYMQYSSAVPRLSSSSETFEFKVTSAPGGYSSGYTPSGATARGLLHGGKITHYLTSDYTWSPSQYVAADFSYDSYRNQWVSMRVTIANGYIYYFVNGDLVGSGPFSKPTADKFYIKSSGSLYLDELRVTTGSLSSTGVYTPPNQPYDTNKVLALPDSLTGNTIYVQSNIDVTTCRIGGVRPSNPSRGFFYIPLHEDHTGGQPQLYDGNNWIEVTATVYNGTTTKNALGFTFAPVGSSPDVDADAKPERPDKPGDDVDPETCKHDWKETKRTDATCSTPGSVESTCSRCEKKKTESLPKLGHTWEIKQTTQTTYDENGNVLSQGFTIYRCSVCGEEYKDTDGSGPPGSSSKPGGDTGEEEEGFLGWLLRKIGEVLGTIGDGILGLLQATLGKILDGIIELVTMAFDKLTQLVDLFGSFGDALGVLWTWLPSEVMLVLVAGVTVFVFIALLKLFLK